jgi:hypothetical protein
MMDHVVGAIPNPPEAVAAAPSLPAVLPVISSLAPAVQALPLLVVLLLGAVVPSPQDRPSAPALPPALLATTPYRQAFGAA